MKAKHARILRDIEHKVSHEVVEFAAERQAGTIVIGDIRDIADGIACGTEHNGRMSRLDHGKIRTYIAYKAEAEGIKVELVDEHHTTKTCPGCGQRHKPRGRTYRCPSCRFQAHRDVVGQVNILSRFLEGDVGRIPAPADVKYRIPRNVRVLRRRCGHQPGSNLRSPGERSPAELGPTQEAAGLEPVRSVTPSRRADSVLVRSQAESVRTGGSSSSARSHSAACLRVPRPARPRYSPSGRRPPQCKRS